MTVSRASAGQRLGDRRVAIEAFASLVERRHRQIGAEPDIAGVGRERAGQ